MEYLSDILQCKMYIYIYVCGYATSSSYEQPTLNLVGILPLISLELEEAQNKADHA